jgi:sporulation protein YlmC with PRC-barrel domain
MRPSAPAFLARPRARRPPRQSEEDPMHIVKPDRRVLSASSLAKDDVKNGAGEKLGDIKDIMIDTETGRVAYAVLSFGGFLGLGDKLFAVPWNAMRLNAEDHSFVLDVDKETLKNAPGFDKDHWPDFADPTWGASIYKHYKIAPYW